jgi:hypothetical protein
LQRFASSISRGTKNRAEVNFDRHSKERCGAMFDDFGRRPRQQRGKLAACSGLRARRGSDEIAIGRGAPRCGRSLLEKARRLARLRCRVKIAR